MYSIASKCQSFQIPVPAVPEAIIERKKEDIFLVPTRQSTKRVNFLTMSRLVRRHFSRLWCVTSLPGIYSRRIMQRIFILVILFVVTGIPLSAQLLPQPPLSQSEFDVINAHQFHPSTLPPIKKKAYN